MKAMGGAAAGLLNAQALPSQTASSPQTASSAQTAPSASEDRTALLRYFTANARSLLRPAEGVLRFPSISPSLPHAQYSTELWDWDTLWTARGLFRVAELNGDADLKAAVAEHARGSLQNFFDHQSPEGRIPILITVKKADPLGCLKGSRPFRSNQAKPVFAQIALLVVEQTGDAAFFAPWLDKLQRFYDAWTVDNLNRTGLLVWSDDVGIGNDNDPTTFGRPPFSSANPLLNCLYYADLKAAAVMAQRLGRAADAARFADTAGRLGAAIEQHIWDERDRFFYTADVQCVDRRAELIPNIARGMAMSWESIPLRIQTFTGFLPMWCGLATKPQAAELVKHLENPLTFGAKFGVRTLSEEESMYSLERSTNPSNWLGPVWIIANYMVWKGLVQFGYTAQADRLGRATAAMLAADLARSGSLNEYYNPDTGQPLSHAGFMDWNLLVLEMV